MKTTLELPNYPVGENILCHPMTEKDWEEYFSLRDKLDVEMSNDEINSKIEEINNQYLQGKDEVAGKLVASLPLDADLAFIFKCTGGYKVIQEFNLSQAKKKYPKEFGVKADSNPNEEDETIGAKDRLSKDEVDALCRIQAHLIRLFQQDKFANIKLQDLLYDKLCKIITKIASENNLLKITEVELYLLAISYKTERIYNKSPKDIKTNMTLLNKWDVLRVIFSFTCYFSTYEPYKHCIIGAISQLGSKSYNGLPSDNLVYCQKHHLSHLNKLKNSFSMSVGFTQLSFTRYTAFKRSKYLYQQKQIPLMDEYVTHNPDSLIAIAYSKRRERIIKNIDKQLKEFA